MLAPPLHEFEPELLRPVNPDFAPLTEGLPLWRLAWSPELVALSQAFDRMATEGLEARHCEQDHSDDDEKKPEFRVDHIKKKHFLKTAGEFNDNDRYDAYIGLANGVSGLLLPTTAVVTGFRYSQNPLNDDHFFEFTLDEESGAELRDQSRASFFVAQAIAGINPAEIHPAAPFPEIRAAYVSGTAPESLVEKVEDLLTKFTSEGTFEVDLSASPQILVATAFDNATTR